jgi:hypothetical protein
LQAFDVHLAHTGGESERKSKKAPSEDSAYSLTRARMNTLAVPLCRMTTRSRTSVVWMLRAVVMRLSQNSWNSKSYRLTHRAEYRGIQMPTKM